MGLGLGFGFRVRVRVRVRVRPLTLTEAVVHPAGREWPQPQRQAHEQLVGRLGAAALGLGPLEHCSEQAAAAGAPGRVGVRVKG